MDPINQNLHQHADNNTKDLLAKADSYAASGKYEEARQVYNNIISENEKNIFLISVINRKIANTYTAQWAFEDSVPYFEKAESLFDLSEIMTDEVLNEWIELQIDYGYAIHATHRFDIFKEKSLRLKPIVNSKGGNVQKIRYLKLVYTDLLRRYRWHMLPEEAISHCQLIIKLAESENDAATEIWGRNILGFTHLWRHEPNESRLACFKALALLEKFPNDEGTCMAYSYIAFSYRKEKKIDKVKEWTDKALQHAKQNGNEAYYKLNVALLGWLYLKNNQLDEAEKHSMEVLDFLKMHKHPFLPIALLPLISISLQKKDTSKAIEYAFMLLHPEVQQLPDSITHYFNNALDNWGTNNYDDAAIQLGKAIDAADKYGYL